MIFFDAHGDILTDVQEQMELGLDIWKDYHKPKYEQARVSGSIFVNFTDPNSSKQKQNFERITQVAIPYFQNAKDINIISKAEDFSNERFNLVLGIEGLNALEDEKDIIKLYEQGYRHASLTWNEKNEYATGAFEKGSLTEKGRKLVNEMNKLNMIIDYAHLNSDSYFAVAEISDKPIFVSHGNIKSLCNHPRNLTDEQLELIKKTNGVIGLAAMNFFLNENPQEATINNLVEQIVYVKENFGIDHVGLGFDFCYYLGDHNDQNAVKGLEHIQCVTQLPKLLKEVGFNDEQVNKVCYGNMERVIKEILQ